MTAASTVQSPAAELVARHVITELSRFGYRFGSEAQLHDGIAEVLRSGGLRFTREVRISEKDRLDFLVDGGVTIEVKIAGSYAEALQQSARYLDQAEVDVVIIATTCGWGRAAGSTRQKHQSGSWVDARSAPACVYTKNGKTVHVAALRRAGL